MAYRGGMHRMHLHPPSPPPPCASPPSQPERLFMRKDEAVGTGQQETNASLFSCDLIIFCRISLYIKNRRGLVNIPFNRYSKLYDAAGKLTTHGSQHFHKQNGLKAVAFLGHRWESAIACWHAYKSEPGEAEGTQQETCTNFADTSSCMCKVPVVLYFLCYFFKIWV